MSLKKINLLNLNWSCSDLTKLMYKHTCTAVLALYLYCTCTVLESMYIIEKSVMGELFVFCLVRLDPEFNSQ